ncbi:hypothetical protein [Actinophytocola sp.]|uniref:hypothetical protein n=1 Tax=Actinophytocola sp. TaxID=1872138 RepID=UPI002ED2015A
MRRWRLAAVLLVTVSAASACGSADDVARAWMSGTDDILRVSKVQTSIPRVPKLPGSLRGQLDDHLQAMPAPANVSPSVRVALERSAQQARDLRIVYAYADDVWARVLAMDEAAPSIVVRSARTELKADAIDLLAEAGREIGRETVCGLAWELMTPDEHALAEQSGYGIGGTAAELVGLTTDSLVAAIAGLLRSRYLTVFVDPEVVDWLLYANDLYEKAAAVTADGDETLVVFGSPASRALVQYARLCLAPPR